MDLKDQMSSADLDDTSAIVPSNMTAHQDHDAGFADSSLAEAHSNGDFFISLSSQPQDPSQQLSTMLNKDSATEYTMSKDLKLMVDEGQDMRDTQENELETSDGTDIMKG